MYYTGLKCCNALCCNFCQKFFFKKKLGMRKHGQICPLNLPVPMLCQTVVSLVNELSMYRTVRQTRQFWLTCLKKTAKLVNPDDFPK